MYPTKFKDFSKFAQALESRCLSMEPDEEKPTPAAISKSFDILQELAQNNQIPIGWGPSVEKGIGITWETITKKFAYIEVLNCQVVLFLIDTNGHNRSIWEIEFDNQEEIKESVQKVINHLNHKE